MGQELFQDSLSLWQHCRQQGYSQILHSPAAHISFAKFLQSALAYLIDKF